MITNFKVRLGAKVMTRGLSGLLVLLECAYMFLSRALNSIWSPRQAQVLVKAGGWCAEAGARTVKLTRPRLADRPTRSPPI
jgi:hypothetical protein